MKKLLAVPVLLLLVVSGFGQDGSGHSIYSYAFGEKYASYITGEKLAKSPSWDMAHSDSPPLPPGKAIRLANVLKDKLVKDSKDYKWHLESVALSNLGGLSEGSDSSEKCWWSVTYEAHVREGGSSGPPDELIIIVLMDGTVIVPEVSDAK